MSYSFLNEPPHGGELQLSAAQFAVANIRATEPPNWSIDEIRWEPAASSRHLKSHHRRGSLINYARRGYYDVYRAYYADAFRALRGSIADEEFVSTYRENYEFGLKSQFGSTGPSPAFLQSSFKIRIEELFWLGIILDAQGLVSIAVDVAAHTGQAPSLDDFSDAYEQIYMKQPFVYRNRELYTLREGVSLLGYEGEIGLPDTGNGWPFLE